MNEKFTYLFNGVSHADTSETYMLKLGMNAEQVESVLRQKEYEEGDGAIAKRQDAYARESDKLFLEWQYDRTTEAEKLWRDKVAEIKARYPI